MPKQITQVHLAVYHELMEWRRLMYDEEPNRDKVMGVAGEAWHWAELTPGDLLFIQKQVDKLVGVKSEAPARLAPDKLQEEDLTV